MVIPLWGIKQFTVEVVESQKQKEVNQISMTEQLIQKNREFTLLRI